MRRRKIEVINKKVLVVCFTFMAVAAATFFDIKTTDYVHQSDEYADEK